MGTYRNTPPAGLVRDRSVSRQPRLITSRRRLYHRYGWIAFLTAALLVSCGGRPAEPGSRFFDAYRARENGDEKAADALFREAALAEAPPWDRLALPMIDFDLRGPSRRLLGRCREAYWSNPDDPVLRAVLLRALDSAGRNDELARRFRPVTGVPEEALAIRAAVSGGAVGVGEAVDTFVLLCPDPEFLTLLPAEGPWRTIHLLRARVAVYEKRHTDALEAFRRWFSEPAFVEYVNASGVPRAAPVWIREFGRAARGADIGDPAISKAIDALRQHAASLPGNLRSAVLLEIADLAADLGLSLDRRTLYWEAAVAADHGSTADRALRRYLDAHAGFGLDSRLKAIRRVAGIWDNPERFTSRIDALIHDAAYRGSWRLLDEGFRDGGDRWPGDSRARAAHLLASATAEGRLTGGRERVQEYLTIAADVGEINWSRLRAAGLLGDHRPLFDVISPSDTGLDRPTDGDHLLRGLTKNGLTVTAARLALSHPDRYTDETLRRVAEALSAAGDHRTAIRVIARLEGRPGYRPTRKDLMIRYPRPFRPEISDAAAESGIPAEILDAVILIESAWDVDAISRVGAVGLMQLMPETAAEWIRRLRLPENTDHTEITINLLLGTSYIQWLSAREWTDGWSEILLAYNAGGGRLRRWKRTVPGYGDDLLIEWAPYPEARSYARRVLSAATVYGYLYGGVSPTRLHEKWGLASLDP